MCTHGLMQQIPGKPLLHRGLSLTPCTVLGFVADLTLLFRLGYSARYSSAESVLHSVNKVKHCSVPGLSEATEGYQANCRAASFEKDASQMPWLELIDRYSVSGFHHVQAFVSVLQKSITLCLRVSVPRSGIQRGQTRQSRCHSACGEEGVITPLPLAVARQDCSPLQKATPVRLLLTGSRQPQFCRLWNSSFISPGRVHSLSQG